MRHFIFLCAFIQIWINASGQEADTLARRILNDIVITGVRIEADTLQSFYRANPGATTEQILGKLSGVSLIRRGAFGQEPIIRGLSAGQLNITIDGMKIFGACTDRMDPVTIYVEPVNLSAVQAITGADASIYGSTFGGSLNMKLAEVRMSERLSGNAGTTFQSASSSIATYVSVNAAAKRSGIRASVTHRKSENYRSGNGRRVPFSQYEKLNAGLSAKWAASSADTLRADALVDYGWNIGFPALPMDVSNARAGIYSIGYQRAASLWIFNSATVKAYHNRVVHSMDDYLRPGIHMRMVMPGRSITSGVYAEGDIHIFHNHRTILRTEFYSNALLGEMIMYPEEGAAMYMQTAPNSTRTNAGIYFQQDYRLQKTRFSFFWRADNYIDRIHAGFGYDQFAALLGGKYDRGSMLHSGGVNVKRNITGNLMIEAKASYGERMATLNERFGCYLFNRYDGYDYLGNPRMRNETSWSAETALTLFANGVEIQFTPYARRISNYIMGSVLPDYSPMTAGARGVKQYFNIDHAYMAGVDAMMLSRPFKSAQWITSVKYVHGTTEWGPMPLMPPLKLMSSLRYSIGKVFVQGEVEYASSQRRVSSHFGEAPTQAYIVSNTSAGYSYKNWRFSAAMENMFDRHYREHLDWGGIPRPGRNLVVSGALKF